MCLFMKENYFFKYVFFNVIGHIYLSAYVWTKLKLLLTYHRFIIISSVMKCDDIVRVPLKSYNFPTYKIFMTY